MRRFQARRGSGRFTRNTLENTFGLHAGICAACHRLNPHGVSEAAPDVCQHCGAAVAICAHGRCAGIPDPVVMRNGGYQECGKPAVASDVARRWPVCSEHVQRAG